MLKYLRPLRPLCGQLAQRSFSISRSARFNPGLAPIDPVKWLSRHYKYTKPSDITPLKEAHALYATIHIHDRKFLVTEGDKLTLPVDMKDVELGDVLNFDQVSQIGSRDYTLSGGPRIDSKVFTIKGTVIEKTKEKRRILERTKRRRRHTRHVVVQNPLTVIRISELKVNPDY